MIEGSESWPWDPGTDLKFPAESKHAPRFPKRLPLLLRFYRFGAGVPVSRNYHDYLELAYVNRGGGLFVVEDRTYRMREGDVFVLNDSEFHALETRHPERLELITIYFLPQLVHRPGGLELDFEYLQPFYARTRGFSHRIPADSSPVSRLIPERIPMMHRELTRKNSGYRLAVKAQLLEILVTLARHYKKQRARAAVLPHRPQQFHKLRTVFDYLQEHYTERIALKDAAARAGMSTSHFCSVFKRLTGGTFMELLLRMRIDKARQLLIQTDLPVTDIAFRVGFENHSYFDRVFRRFARITPREYRRKVKRQISLR